MLTPDSLSARLKDWSTEFRATVLAHAPSPIELYQRLFGLVHGFKASIQLSEDNSIQSLIETALASDQILVKLAYGEIELNAIANAQLYKLATNLTSLEPLESLLKTTVPDAVPLACEAPKLLALPYSWDAMSRARALSCTKHGYLFFTREDRLTLTALPALDTTLQAGLGPINGLVVVRRLDVLAPQGSDLGLNASVIAAIPRSTSLSAEWKSLF